MSRKCQQHNQTNCEFVYLKPKSSKEVVICPSCIDDSEGRIKMFDCVPLNYLLEANPQTIVQRYPPLNNQELNQRILNFSGSIDDEINKTKLYYQDLIKNFKAEVKKAMLKSKTEIDQLYKLRESFIKSYSEVSQTEKLKQLVIQSQKDQNAENQLFTFIQAKQNEATATANKLSDLANQLQNQKESFSAYQPEKQKSVILQEIERISFFKKPIPGNQPSQNFNLPQQSTQRRSIVSQITMKPSNNVGDSVKHLSIDRINNNQIQIKNIGRWGQCVFESALNPKKNYIISILANVEMIGDPENLENQEPWFRFGIMPFLKRHDESIEENGICYNECSDCYGISKMVKGEKLNLGEDFDINMNNYWRKNNQRRFEVRINLEKGILKVSQIPDYSLVAEIDEDRSIDLSKDHTFAIHNIGVGSTIIVENIYEADSFDNLM